MKPLRFSAIAAGSRAGGLYLLLAIQAFADAGNGLRAEEKTATKAPAPVVWTPGDFTSVRGQKPEVLGAPKVVDKAADGPALQFNGENDGLVFPVNPLEGWVKFTIEVLVLPETDGPPAQRFMHIQDERSNRCMLETRIIEGKSWSLDTFLLCGESRCALLDRTKLHPTGKWAWVALVYDGKKITHYVNGVKELEGTVSPCLPMMSGRMSLGVRLNRMYWFKGSLKEVRLTPVALPPETLQRVTAN